MENSWWECKGRTEASVLFGEVCVYLLQVKQLISVREKWGMVIIKITLAVPDCLFTTAVWPLKLLLSPRWISSCISEKTSSLNSPSFAVSNCKVQQKSDQSGLCLPCAFRVNKGIKILPWSSKNTYAVTSFGFVFLGFCKKRLICWMGGFVQAALPSLSMCHLSCGKDWKSRSAHFPSRSPAGSWILCGLYNQDSTINQTQWNKLWINDKTFQILMQPSLCEARVLQTWLSIIVLSWEATTYPGQLF